MVLIKSVCGKRFVLNPEKHLRDDYVYCPFCGEKIKNEYRARILPSFSLNWLREKLEARKRRVEATKFLDKYFPVNLVSGERAFSLSSWMMGKRPAVPLENVIHVLGDKPPHSLVEAELAYLKGLGVKVTQKKEAFS